MLSCFSYVWLCSCSLPSCSVHRIFQAWILEWVAMLSSRASSQRRDGTCISYLSCVGSQVLYHQRHLGRPWYHTWLLIYWQCLEKVLKTVVSSGGGKKWFYREGFQRWWWEKYWFPFFLLPSPAHSVNSLCILTVAMIPLVTVAPRKVLNDSA